jgi:hypothetical protein
VNDLAMILKERVKALGGFQKHPDIGLTVEKKGDLLGDEIADGIASFGIGAEEGDPHRDPSMEMPA